MKKLILHNHRRKYVLTACGVAALLLITLAGPLAATARESRDRGSDPTNMLKVIEEKIEILRGIAIAQAEKKSDKEAVTEVADAATEGVKDVLTFYEELKQQAIDDMESDRDDNDGGTMKDARTHNQKLSLIEQNVALLREAINQGADGAVNEAESAVDEAMTMVRKLAKDFEDRSGINRDDMEGEELLYLKGEELEGEELP